MANRFDGSRVYREIPPRECSWLRSPQFAITMMIVFCRERPANYVLLGIISVQSHQHYSER